MMEYTELLKQLTHSGAVPQEQADGISDYEKNKPFSVHWELRTFLYTGITLLGAGLGTVVYQNIDSIGHDVLIGLIVLVFAGCMVYVFKHRRPFNWDEVEETDKLDDFALLGACVVFLTLEGYLQYQYNVFGTRYGIAAFLPAVLFFYLAYRFDHRGVLSMAITAFASWVGVSIAPIRVWQQKNFSSTDITHISILLGVVLIAIGIVSEYKKLKAHFSFTYLLFGSNIAFVATLAGLFQFDRDMLYLPLIGLLCWASIWYSRRTQSFLFLLMGVLYAYIGITYAVMQFEWMQDFNLTFYTLYFMATAIGVVWFFMNINQILGRK